MYMYCVTVATFNAVTIKMPSTPIAVCCAIKSWYS